MSEKTLPEIAEQMAEAIREWNRAKREREEWKPVPGMVPPAKYLDNARNANILLAKALEEYEAFQQSVQADECPHCHAKPAYTDQQTYPDICSECGTRR